MSREVVIVAYGRSAVCKSRKGSFAGTHPIEYSAQVLKGVLDKVPQLDRSEIEDVIMGCAVQHGTTSMNIAKSVCARAELPECVAGHTINRFLFFRSSGYRNRCQCNRLRSVMLS